MFNVPNVNILLYADDISVYTLHKILNVGIERLNAAFTIIARVFDDLYFTLAPSKSKCMIFSKRRIMELHIFALQGTEIPLVQNKYLGLVLDSKLSWAPYIEYLSSILFKS